MCSTSLNDFPGNKSKNVTKISPPVVYLGVLVDASEKGRNFADASFKFLSLLPRIVRFLQTEKHVYCFLLC